ncbi:single-stranded-DNA-specific exonuclease RecJ [Candidatus Omnitrophota bacterium]
MQNHKILNILPPNRHLQDALSKELGISRILSQILANRGIKSKQEAKEFLKPKLSDLLDANLFSDMRKAVKLLRDAAKKKQRVMIFGDYDADGITGLALLKTRFKKMGLEVEHYLPHRVHEGYGLNKKILQICKEKRIDILVSVDCGTNDHGLIKELRREKVEVIITDHHEPSDPDKKSMASALLNPKVKSCGYKFRDLAGVGVAYKLCQALANDPLADDMDLVAIGTIADIVPLVGENRIFAKEGLARISQTRRLGLRALMDVAGISGKKMSSRFVSFILGPRINASGRIDTAETSLALLLADSDIEAKRLAQIVHSQNRERQKIERGILEEAQDIIDREVNFKDHKVIVIAKENWHQGVLGIVASKLADRFYRPTIVLSLTDDLCKGSGRSIKNFHLLDALLHCKDQLHTFGGHSHAVGLVVKRSNIDDFRQSINRLAHDKLRIEDLLPCLEVDMELPLAQLGEAEIIEFEALEPFGRGNPNPKFYSRGLKVKGEAAVLSRDTLKFWVSEAGITYPAIGFGMSSSKQSVEEADSIDLVYSPRIDTWQGEDSIILEIEEIFLNRE